MLGSPPVHLLSHLEGKHHLHLICHISYIFIPASSPLLPPLLSSTRNTERSNIGLGCFFFQRPLASISLIRTFIQGVTWVVGMYKVLLSSSNLPRIKRPSNERDFGCAKKIGVLLINYVKGTKSLLPILKRVQSTVLIKKMLQMYTNIAQERGPATCFA